jgi:hypothetical protein
VVAPKAIFSVVIYYDHLARFRIIVVFRKQAIGTGRIVGSRDFRNGKRWVGSNADAAERASAGHG